MATPEASLKSFCVGPEATVREALAAIDRGASRIALVVDGDGQLQGIVTDGDIRRSLLKGAHLDSPVLPYVNASPRVVGRDVTRASVLDMMRSLRISEVPIVDAAGRLAGLHTLTDMVGRPTLKNAAVIMAGGKGTRLGALTKDTPKPLMTVADRPIIDWIILGLVESGVREVFVSVAYLAHKIVEHLGDGSQLGCTINYLHEDPEKPLNTAGALGLFRKEHGQIDESLIVTNADLMARYSARDLLDFHEANESALTIVSRTYTHQVPFGVLELGDNRLVQGVTEKPTLGFEISAGIYAVRPETLDLVPYMEPYSMPDLVKACIDTGRNVAAWPMESDWIDVGTPKDLATAKGQ
ncbi:sugar phosphate nucleotidyltransferase [Sinomonas halotolerans]|uniref:Sugar phosphate nucleotidyltransferase n=1 Tax=Sinomonas halotolerans TaxID=1644133 RepID=A0ABU9WXF0_9MICC